MANITLLKSTYSHGHGLLAGRWIPLCITYNGPS